MTLAYLAHLGYQDAGTVAYGARTAQLRPRQGSRGSKCDLYTGRDTFGLLSTQMQRLENHGQADLRCERTQENRCRT